MSSSCSPWPELSLSWPVRNSVPSLSTVIRSFRTTERMSSSPDKLSVDFGGVRSFLSSATSIIPATANTACAAATERLNRVVAGTSTLRVHWKGLLSLSGSQMVGRILRGVTLNRELRGGRGLGLVEAAEAVAVPLKSRANYICSKIAVRVGR